MSKIIKTFLPLGRIADLMASPCADRIAVQAAKGVFGDYTVITFPSREAMVAFLRKQKGAGLYALVKIPTPRNLILRPWLETEA